MASITTRPNGSKFITFMSPSGSPRHITLGKVPKRYAESLKVRVEDLVSAAIHSHPPSDDTCRWLTSLDDWLYNGYTFRLVGVRKENGMPRKSGVRQP